MRKLVIASAIVLAGGGALGFLAPSGPLLHSARPSAQLLAWDDPETVARGSEIYDRDCAACHGSLEGKPLPANARAPEDMAPPHDETGHSWEHPDFALFQLTKTGEATALCRTLDREGMPQFDQVLNDRQIVDVLSYVKSTWPDHIRVEQDAVNMMYEAQNSAYRDLVHGEES